MKKLKKLLSIVLAVAMVMSLAVSVTATQSTTYSITISNPEEGETYSAYKIFDVTYNGTNYSYTIDSQNNPFYTAISEACDDTGDSLYGYLTLTPSASDLNIYVVKYDASAGTDTDFMEKLAAVIKSVIDDNTVTTTPAASETAGSTNLTLDVTSSGAGYYYVNTTVGSVVALTTTDPTVTISNKWLSPAVDKGVYNDAPADDPTVTGTSGSYDTTGETGGTTGDSDAAIGDKVYYQTTITNIYDISNLVLHDTMTEGLTFDSSSVVVKLYDSITYASGQTLTTSNYTITTPGYYYVGTIDSTTFSSGTYYTYTAPSTYTAAVSWDANTEYYVEDTFDISFDLSTLTTAVDEGAYLVVTYYATVNSSAVIYNSGSNDNETYVSYGNASMTTADLTQTYVYAVNIFKYTGNSVVSTAYLDGAEFQIYYIDDNGDKQYAVLTVNSEGNYTLGSWSTTSGTTITTDDDGFIYIEGLDADKTYYLVETKAPTGYNLLSDPIAFIIAGSDSTTTTQGTVTYDTETSTYNKNGITGTTGDSTLNNVIPVKNSSGEELPETGGIGVTIFYVVGGILVLAAAGVIVISKKKIKK